MHFWTHTRSRVSGCSRVAAVFILVMSAGCNRAGEEPVAPLSINLRSADVAGGVLGKDFTCQGEGLSPELSWTAPPPQTRSLALVVTDRDSPLGYNFVHWVMYNIPSGTRILHRERSGLATLPDTTMEGVNDNDKPGYAPPCPPARSVHRYDFILYAVDMNVKLPSASKKELLDAIRGHVLARGELITRYGTP